MASQNKQFNVSIRVRSSVEANNFVETSSSENNICIKNKLDVQKIQAFYNFDFVFDEQTKQIDLYSKTVVPLFEVFLKGHNATILAVEKRLQWVQI